MEKQRDHQIIVLVTGDEEHDAIHRIANQILEKLKALEIDVCNEQFVVKVMIDKVE